MGVLRFGFFGFQVHIQPSFWLVALLLASSARRNVVEHLTLVGIVFVSLLGHELGHALVARRAGLSPIVVIHAFGGVTKWLPLETVPRGRSIAIALAGPAAGLFIAACAVVALAQIPHASTSASIRELRQSLVTLAQVNGFWSVVNLLPIMPFDGGQVLQHLLGPKRRRLAAHVSLVVGIVAAAILFRLGLRIAAIVFVAAGVIQFVVSLRTLRQNVAVDSVRLELLIGQARRALEEGNNEAAAKSAEAVVQLANDDHQRRSAAEILAWASLAQEQPDRARRALELLVGTALDPLLQAAMLESEGDVDRAIACLRQARVAGDDRPQLAASLVRLLLAADRFGEAALTTIQILEHVSVEEARQVMAACRAGSRPIPAAELSMALYSHTEDVNDLAWALVSYFASGSREGVRKLLAVATEKRVDPEQLLGCEAFETVAMDGELRVQVDETLGAVNSA